MTGLHIAVFVTSLLGFTSLALAMPKHGKSVFRQPLSDNRRKTLRLAGWLLLTMALTLGIYRWQFDIGTVTWLGWLSIAGLMLVFVLAHWATEAKNQANNKVRPPKRQSKQAPGSIGNANTGNSEVAWCLPTPRTVFAAAALLIPLVWFTAALLSTPQKPLLRDDAIHAEIGPWSFTLAEKDHESPEIVAMDVPLKTFVIRFCETCERDIRLAYLKIRKPHSLRTAGNAFEGRGSEKTAEVPIPRAASLDDGLWLTVEATRGEVYHQRFDIERLSPSLARFIQERP